MVPSSLLLLAMLTSEQRLIRCLNRIIVVAIIVGGEMMGTSYHVLAFGFCSPLLLSVPAIMHLTCVRVGESWPGQC